MSIVSPMCAWSTNSLAIRRIVAAGTSQIGSAHSGEYGAMWATSLPSPVSPVEPPIAQHVVVGADFDGIGVEAAFDRLDDVRRVVWHRCATRAVPDQRLPCGPVAQVIPAGTDQIGRRGVPSEERDVEPPARDLVQQHVDERVQERGVGLGSDRHPFRGARAGDREVRLDLDPLHPAYPRVGVTPDADDAARGLDVGAAGDEIVAKRRVGRHGECAMPELAVQMFRVVALDALARAEAHVDRPPGAEESGERAHVRLRRASAAEAYCETRITRFVGQAGGAHRVELAGDEIERLVPRDRHETGILGAPFLRIAALHRRQHAVRVVRLLHQPVRLHAHLAATRVNFGGAEVRLDLGRHAIDDLDRQQVGPRDALVAVRRHVLGDTRGNGRLHHVLERVSGNRELCRSPGCGGNG